MPTALNDSESEGIITSGRRSRTSTLTREMGVAEGVGREMGVTVGAGREMGVAVRAIRVVGVG